MLSSAVYSLGVETAGPPGGHIAQTGGKVGLVLGGGGLEQEPSAHRNMKRQGAA